MSHPSGAEGLGPLKDTCLQVQHSNGCDAERDVWRDANRPRRAGREPMLAARTVVDLEETAMNFARCMRPHGVGNWPDPRTSTSPALALGARPCMFHLDGLPEPGGRSFSPQITRAMTECQHLTGSQVPCAG